MQRIEKNQRTLAILIGNLAKSLTRMIAICTSVAIFTSGETAIASQKIGLEKDKDHIGNYQRHISGVNFNASDLELIKADKIRRQSLKSTYSLINDKTLSNQEKFELYLRLGQVHLERHDFLKHIEMIAFNEKHEKFMAQKKTLTQKGQIQKAKSLAEPTFLQTGSIAELKKSIKALTYAVKNYPKERRLDIAYFTLGQSNLLLKAEKGKDYLKILLQKFPKSTLVPDANLALGEYYFDKNEPTNAIPFYKVLLSHKDHKGYLYAVYKLGWANYKLSFQSDKREILLNKALAGFKIAIRQSEKKRWSGSFNLREEVLNDIILVFSEIGDIELARSYFVPKSEEDRFYLTVMRIGGKLTEAGKSKEAIAAYRTILEETPYSEHIPLAFEQIIKNHEASDELKKIPDVLEEMVSFLGTDGLWAKKEPALDASITLEARKNLEATMQHYSTKYHNIGQKSANKTFLISAAKIYKAYLNEFPDTEKATEIRHYLADVLLGFKQYEQAGIQFMIVVKSNFGKKFQKEALNSALYSFEGAIKQTKFAKLEKAGSLTQKQDIPKLKSMYLDALDSLIVLYPKDKRLAASRYTIATTLYNYGHYDNALTKFIEMTKLHPSDKLANNSSKLTLTHYFTKREWEKTIATSAEFLANQDLMKQKGLKEFILDLNKDAYFNYAGDLEKSHEYIKSANLFIQFQKKFPTDKNADKALYNASLNYHKGGDTNKSIDTGKSLISTYKNSPLTKDMTAWVADTLESTARFPEAIAYYKLFHSRYPNDRRARDFLYNSAMLSMGMEKNQESIELFELFVKFYPKDDNAEFIKFNMAELNFKTGNPTEARKIFEWLSFNGSTNEKRLEAKAQGLVILLRQDEKSGKKRLNSFAEQLSKSKEAAYSARQIVGEEMLKSLEPDILSYNKLSIKDGNQLMRDIQAKNNMLVALSKKLEEVASVGLSEYSVAALYILGDLHKNIARDILKAPLPSDISPEEQTDIKKQLNDVSGPLFDDAKAFYRRSYETAQKINTFSDWSIKIARKMKDEFPDEFVTAELEAVRPDYLSHTVILDDNTKNLLK